MAIQDMNPADIAAVVNSKDNDGFGNGNGWWIILLFLFLGWGNNGMRNSTGESLYPWLNQSENVMAGFGELSQSLCNGFAGTTAAITNGFANAETAASSRQMANMQQQFALSQQLYQLNAQLASEACANRTAVSDGIRDILANQNAAAQRILDQMCQDKIDEKNDTIAQLRTQIQVQNLAASQTAQTATILANNEAQTTALEQYLAPVARPAYIVQNPNGCSGLTGYGCGSVTA